MELNQKTLEELKELCCDAGDVFECDDLQYLGEDWTNEGFKYYYFRCPTSDLYVQNEEGDWVVDSELDGDDYDYFDFIYLGGVWYLWRLDKGYRKGIVVLGEYTYKEEA